MKKPKDWYGFKVACKLYDFGQSNMTPPSRQQYCLRKDRQGNDRPYWKDHEHFALLSCHWNVCPKLKELRRKAGNNQISCPPFSMYGHKNTEISNALKDIPLRLYPILP